MAERKVFGRRWFTIDGQDWKFELRKDGLYIRKRGYHHVWLVPNDCLINICKRQLEFFNETILRKSDKTKPVPDLPKGQLVPHRGEVRPVHESAERQA